MSYQNHNSEYRSPSSYSNQGYNISRYIQTEQSDNGSRGRQGCTIRRIIIDENDDYQKPDDIITKNFTPQQQHNKVLEPKHNVLQKRNTQTTLNLICETQKQKFKNNDNENGKYITNERQFYNGEINNLKKIIHKNESKIEKIQQGYEEKLRQIDKKFQELDCQCQQTYHLYQKTIVQKQEFKKQYEKEIVLNIQLQDELNYQNRELTQNGVVREILMQENERKIAEIENQMRMEDAYPPMNIYNTPPLGSSPVSSPFQQNYNNYQGINRDSSFPIETSNFQSIHFISHHDPKQQILQNVSTSYHNNYSQHNHSYENNKDKSFHQVGDGNRKYQSPKQKLDEISFLIHGESLNLSESGQQNRENLETIENLNAEIQKLNLQIKVYQEIIKSNDNSKDLEAENRQLKEILMKIKDENFKIQEQNVQILEENNLLQNKIFNKIDQVEENRDLQRQLKELKQQVEEQNNLILHLTENLRNSQFEFEKLSHDLNTILSPVQQYAETSLEKDNKSTKRVRINDRQNNSFEDNSSEKKDIKQKMSLTFQDKSNGRFPSQENSLERSILQQSSVDRGGSYSGKRKEIKARSLFNNVEEELKKLKKVINICTPKEATKIPNLFE